MTIADILIIVVYIVAMFGVGVYARTRIKSVDDFLVAGNRFKTFSLVGTLVAALTGAGTVSYTHLYRCAGGCTGKKKRKGTAAFAEAD